MAFFGEQPKSLHYSGYISFESNYLNNNTAAITNGSNLYIQN